MVVTAKEKKRSKDRKWQELEEMELFHKISKP